jgi:hypothetical protein
MVDVSLPHTKYALPAYYIVAPAEASSNLARYDGVRYGLRVPGRDIGALYENTRAAGFGREVKRRIMIGTYVLSAGYYDAYYLRAQKIRTLIKRDFETVYAAGIDAVLTPATPRPPSASARRARAIPVEMYLNDIFTVTVNMAGLPGIAVPGGLDAGGLPLGLQLIGRPFDEETLFAASQVIEDAAGASRCPSAGGAGDPLPPYPFDAWILAAFDPVLIAVAVLLGWKADQAPRSGDRRSPRSRRSSAIHSAPSGGSCTCARSRRCWAGAARVGRDYPTCCNVRATQQGPGLGGERRSAGERASRGR